MNSSITAEVAPIATARRDFYTPAELRRLLKQTLGYNARQVTVSARNSINYLTITIRDAAVDIAKVKEFAASCHTWHMDETDYCTGQSVHAVTTREVDAIHAAPFVEEIKRAVAVLKTQGERTGEKLSTGAILWKMEVEYYVSRMDSDTRGNYVRRFNVETGDEWAINALALHASRI